MLKKLPPSFANLNVPLSACITCCVLANASPVYSAVTAAPSGSVPVGGVLAPVSSDTVTVDSTGGDNAVSISNATAIGVTVTITDGTLSPAATRPGINLGSGTVITNGGTVTSSGQLDNNFGAITLRGAGNQIDNNGTIRATGSSPGIQGSLNLEPATDTVLNNTGLIDVVATDSSAVTLGERSQITNTGTIQLLSGNGANTNYVIEVQGNSRIDNLASGIIRGVEAAGATRNVNGIQLRDAGILINAGRIEVIGNTNGPGRGTAVGLDKSGTISNSGTIDASRARTAIGGSGQALITNSGALLGGTGGAIEFLNSENSVLTLRTGSQISGSVVFSRQDNIPLTDAELGNDPAVINYCRNNPADLFCLKQVKSLPVTTTLRLEGAGVEDDHFTGFNLIEKVDPGNWVLGTNLQAGSSTDNYQTGDFRGPLVVNVQDALGQLLLTGDITDNADGTKGQLVKNGVGYLGLYGTNTYSGSTTINSGELEVFNGNAIGDQSAVTLASGALLSLGNSETIGSFAGDGSIALQGNTLTTGMDNTSTVYSGDISGAGQVWKYGTGTLQLSGTSTSTGTFSVLGGILDVAGTVPMAVIAGPSGTVDGNGVIGSLLNIGKVAPGNSVGTLSVTGNYTQGPSGVLETEIRPDGSAVDLLAVGGAASLAGTLAVQGENGALLTPAAGGRTYTILTAGGGVSGQFNPLQPLGAFTFNTIYNPNDVQLGVTYTGFAAIQQGGTVAGTGTTNQIKKAKALDRVPVSSAGFGFNSGNADFDQILLEIANETPDELANTFNQIIAEPYAAFTTVLLEQNDFFAETVLSRARACSADGRSSLAGDFALQPPGTKGQPEQGCANQGRYGVWLDANWVEGNVDGSNGLSGYDYHLAGTVLGIDTAVNDKAAVGIALGVGRPELDDYELADADLDGDSYFAGAYGTWTENRWELSGLLGYTHGEYSSNRRIQFGSINRLATGDFEGDGVISSVKAAYFGKLGKVDIIPDVALTYSKIWQDGFTEKGADSLNLKVDDTDTYSTVTSAGIRIGTELQKGSLRFRPQAMVRYEYDWNAGDDNAHDLQATFADVPSVGAIDVIGQNRGEHRILTAAGVTVQLAENVDIFARAGYNWNSEGDEYTYGAGFRVTW